MAGKPSTEIRMFIGDYEVVFDVVPESEQIKKNPCHGCNLANDIDMVRCWGALDGMVFDECMGLPVFYMVFDECTNLPVFYQGVSITKITHKPATLNYPCGSMGEEIE